MPEILGNVGEQRSRWWQWAEQQPVTELLHSRYARRRLECYYRLAVTLGQPPHIFPAREDAWVQEWGDRLLPGWHSALLCQYRPGVCITPHRDHTCFAAIAVMINLGSANFVEYPGKTRQVTPLADGAIVRLNTKILHGIEPVTTTRYSLTFRHLKPAFQVQQLALDVRSP